MPIRPIDPSKRGLRPALAPAPIAHPANTAAVAAEPPAARKRLRIRPRAPIAAPALPAQGLPPPVVQVPPAKRAHHKVDRSSDNWTEDGDYLVGKGRPPTATQWKKGQSGNPRGPKAVEKLDPQAMFDKEVLASFTAKVNGQDVNLNMGSFAVQLLKAGAAKGGVKAQQILLDLFLTTARKAIGMEAGPEIEAWEQQALEQLISELGLPERPVIRQIDRSVDDDGGSE